MVHRKAKRLVQNSGIHSVSWKEMTKEKQKVVHLVIRKAMRLVQHLVNYLVSWKEMRKEKQKVFHSAMS